MIPVVVALVGVAAFGAGTAAGRWIYRRLRRSQSSARPAHATNDDAHALDPLALGDVLLLEGGRDGELWLVRRLSLRESGDPFLVVFEAYPRVGASRAILAWDPMKPAEVDLLAPSRLAEADVLAHSRQSRPPSTLDVPLDDRRETVQLTMRRVASGEMVVSPEAEGRSDLPRAGEGMLVARYAGSSDVRALVLRDGAGELFTFGGKRIVVDESSVLRDATHAGERVGGA